MHIPKPKCPACHVEQSDSKPLYTYDLPKNKGHKPFRFACAPCIKHIGGHPSHALPTKHYNVSGSNPSGAL